MAGQKKLPPLEYCKLDRASQLLECEVSDLLHLAEIEAIELCIKTNGFNSLLLQSFDTPKLAEDFVKGLHEKVEIFESVIYREGLSIANSMLYHFNLANEITTGIVAVANGKYAYAQRNLYGMWRLINTNLPRSSEGFTSFGGDAFFEVLAEKGEVTLPMKFLAFMPADYENEDCYASLEYFHIIKNKISDVFHHAFEDRFNEITISVSDLWITRKQINKILQANGDPIPEMPSLIDGKVKKQEIPELSQETASIPWVNQARSKGIELKKANPQWTQNKLAKEVRQFLINEGIMGKGMNVPTADTIKRHALQNLGGQTGIA